MKRHIRVTNNKEKVLVDNLTSNCKKCLKNCDFEGRLVSDCPEYGGKRRQGYRETNKCDVFLCCHKTKTTKLFKQKIEALTYSFPDLNIPENEIRISEQTKVNRLVHNLTSINAHNIQEIYDLVPQNILAQNWKKQIEFIRNEVEKNPEKTALMFLRIAKHNTHMKSEFSIYKKIEKDDRTKLEIREHKLRNVLLNTLHTFFNDFTRRNVYIDVADFDFKIYFDYETIQVALYHLIENTAKYTCPKTKVNVSTSENKDDIDLIFEMTSAYVPEKEIKEIMKEGVSGIVARKMGKNGDGIGMWRIKQMMLINNGDFVTKFGEKSLSRTGFNFALNTFTLKFNKNNRSEKQPKL